MKKHARLALSLLRPVSAELFGTALLAAAIGVGVGSVGVYGGYEALYLPFAVACVVGLLVYLVGPVSGAHLNPAVSVGLFAIRRIDAPTLLAYLIAQIAGAFLGLWFSELLVGELTGAPVLVDRSAILAEAAGAFLLVFAVVRVVTGRVPAVLSGLVIGTALLIGLTLSFGASGGILNPALALALDSRQVTYLIMPLIGGLLGAGAAVALGGDAA